MESTRRNFGIPTERYQVVRFVIPDAADTGATGRVRVELDENFDIVKGILFSSSNTGIHKAKFRVVTDAFTLINKVSDYALYRTIGAVPYKELMIPYSLPFRQMGSWFIEWEKIEAAGGGDLSVVVAFLLETSPNALNVLSVPRKSPFNIQEIDITVPAGTPANSGIETLVYPDTNYSEVIGVSVFPISGSSGSFNTVISGMYNGHTVFYDQILYYMTTQQNLRFFDCFMGTKINFSGVNPLAITFKPLADVDPGADDVYKFMLLLK